MNQVFIVNTEYFRSSCIIIMKCLSVWIYGVHISDANISASLDTK